MSKKRKKKRKKTNWGDWAGLLYGIPSVLIAMAAVSVVIAGRMVRRTDLVVDYKQAASQAFQAKDFEAADVYYRKLTWLAENDRSTQFALAITADQLGDHDRAVALMSSLAPIDKAGHGPAHFWLARDYVERARTEKLPPELIATIEPHLLNTIERDPNHVDAHVMLGQLYYGRGRLTGDREQFEKAAKHFAKTVRAYPQYRMSVAAIYQLLGNRSQAASQAKLAGEHFQQQLDANKNDTEARLQLASAQVFLGKFREAAATLTQGTEDATEEDKVRFRKALASVLLKSATVLDPKQDELVGKRLQFLQKALEYDPENPIILAGLAELTKLTGPAADKAREALKDVLSTGRAPATVHLILGTIAMQRENTEEAEYHLNQAFKLSPRMPAALNNLAWLLAYSETPQLERAFNLAHTAVKLQPQNTEIRETRGQILFKLGHHQEALEDLLIALRAYPDRALVHTALAEIYERLGDEGMAQRHRQHVKRIEDENRD